MADSRFKPLLIFAVVVALVAGCAALGFARLTAPFAEADRALAVGQREKALEAYARAERRLGRFEFTRYVFGAEYSRAVRNQLSLLYDAGNYDAVIEKSVTAPAGARPRFWAGTALLARALSETRTDARLLWLNRAEEELREALRASDDWDVRFNYELAARLAESMRRRPPKKTEGPLQLLRPEPAPPRPARKVG